MPANSRASETFRHNVKSILRDKKISQNKLAAEIGTSSAGISNVLSGQEGVTLDRAERIATVLGMPLSALISEKFAATAK